MTELLLGEILEMFRPEKKFDVQFFRTAGGFKSSGIRTVQELEQILTKEQKLAPVTNIIRGDMAVILQVNNID